MSDNVVFWGLVGLAVLAVVVLAIVAARGRARARHIELRRHFGPEYDRVVEETGDTAYADRVLAERAKRVGRFKLRELTRAERDRFSAEWVHVQAAFVDDPAVAVREANALVEQVMRARGYPVDNFEQRLEDLSVEHPAVIDHYRAALTLSEPAGALQVNTEDLRQAVVHYRVIFADLLQEPPPAVARLRDAPAV